jgi:DNA-binding transcriptional ArsR family regulator
MSELTELFTGQPLDRADAEDLAAVFKALSEPARLQLLALLAAAPGETASGVELQEALTPGLSQPTISHHLRILSAAGLIERGSIPGGVTLNMLSRIRLSRLGALLSRRR